MGKCFRSADVNQALLLPPSLHDWLPEKHLARFLVDVVDALDLGAIYASYEEKDGRGQAAYEPTMEPTKIAASTSFDFDGKNLTPYGGLFPVATMLEKLGFQKLVEETLRVKRIPRVMTIYQFVLGMVLAIYIGFSRLNHIRFVANDPMLTGVLKVASLPGQSVFWRCCASLHLSVAQQLLRLQGALRERVWEAANVQLPAITVDTDTTVHTLYGQQMGGRKGYNPKNKGKKSYQPILTFLAETREEGENRLIAFLPFVLRVVP